MTFLDYTQNLNLSVRKSQTFRGKLVGWAKLTQGTFPIQLLFIFQDDQSSVEIRNINHVFYSMDTHCHARVGINSL